MEHNNSAISMASQSSFSMTSVSERENDAAVDVDDMGATFSRADDERAFVDDEGGVDAGGDRDTHHHGDGDHHGHENHHGHEDHHDDGDHHDDEDHSGPLTWREKLRDFLHTQSFQITVIILVVLDCIFVIGELVLDYEALAEANNCPTEEVPTTGESNSSERHRREAEEHGSEAGGHSPTAKAAEALHYLSLVILSIFMIELLLKLIALGTKFFHSKLETFDAIVIIISFILDIITLLFPENFAVVDLIVVLRLWRILRIVNGVILSVEQRAEKKVHHYRRVRDRAVGATMKFEEYSTSLEDEIKALRELLEKNGVKIDEKLTNKLERPHYARKYHTEDEYGHHGLHLHLPHPHLPHPHLPHLHLPHPHLPHLHHRHHGGHGETSNNGKALDKTHHLEPHPSQPPDSAGAGTSLQDEGKPPDYDTLHHQGDTGSSC